MIDTRKKGFSFLEVVMGVLIMTFGLIPLLWALIGGHNQVSITLRQVQASNHAANLLEALRATPFQDLALFPPSMIQIRGGDNKWRKPGEAREVEFILPEIVNSPVPSGATNVFDKFIESFFSKDVPIVPPLESNFRRYFIIMKDHEETPHYITVVVRVEWQKKDRLAAKKKAYWRHVELRTVLADPYFCDS